VLSIEHVGIGFRVQVLRVKGREIRVKVEGLGFDIEG